MYVSQNGQYFHFRGNREDATPDVCYVIDHNVVCCSIILSGLEVSDDDDDDDDSVSFKLTIK